MRIFVELIGKLAKQNESSTFFIYLNDGATIKDFLEKLEKDKKINVPLNDCGVLILLNGFAVGTMDTKLRDLDKVTITPVVYGG